VHGRARGQERERDALAARVDDAQVAQVVLLDPPVRGGRQRELDEGRRRVDDDRRAIAVRRRICGQGRRRNDRERSERANAGAHHA
jgi:hypothetical protein